MKDDGIVQIHGKNYFTVARRITIFRSVHLDYRISSKLIENTENRVVMKSSIYDAAGNLLSTGFAEEFRAASQINKTSALENCETSAVGRALAFLGYGGTEIASADEVQNAIFQQDNPVTYTQGQKTTFDTLLDGNPLDFWLYLQTLPDETKLALYDSFEAGKKTAKKKLARDLESKGSILFAELSDVLKSYIDSEDSAGIEEISAELGDTGKRLAFKELSPEQQHKVQQLTGKI